MAHDNRFDTLRLIAAWLVLFSHCYPLAGRADADPIATWFKLDTAGGVGVGIFFALSGYLITLSMQRSVSLLDFARRRALRIYPALLMVCALSVFVLGPGLSTWPLDAYASHPATWQYLRNASGFETFYAVPGVFDSTPKPYTVNGSLWSLPYELRCYLALMVASALPGSMRMKAAVVLVLLLVLMSIRPGSLAETPFVPFAGLDFYATKLGFIFATGALVATCQDKLSNRQWQWAGAASLCALAFVPGLAGPAQLPLYCAALAFAALYLALQARWLPPIPKRMGDWSYGVYLYGFPVQQTLAMYGLHHHGLAAYLLASTLVTFGLAALSWHCVEKWAIRFK